MRFVLFLLSSVAFAASNLTLTPSTLNMGGQTVGTTSIAQPVTLKNIGVSSVTINTPSFTGGNSGDFSQSNSCGITLAPNSTCVINVTFAPLTIGIRTSSLQASDTTGDSASVSVTATGVSSATPISISGCVSVNASGACTMTFNKNVNLSVQKSGGTFTCTSNCSQTTFTAPSNIVAPVNRFGCISHPVDSVFYAQVNTLPTYSNSDNWTGTLFNNNSNTLWIEIDAPENLMPAGNTTKKAFTYAYNHHYDGVPMPYPPLPYLRQAGVFTLDGVNDHHRFTVDPSDCTTYELYGDRAALGTASSSNVYGPNGNTTYGVGPYDLSPYDSTAAAGIPVDSLQVTAKEARDGINHMMAFTAANYMYSGSYTAHAWPAVSGNGSNSTSQCPGGISANCIVMGAVLRVKPAYCTAHVNDFNDNSVAKNLFVGLCNHGMLLRDIGTEMRLEVATDFQEDTTVINGVSRFNGSIPNSAWEVVDMSNLCVSGNGTFCNNSSANSLRANPSSGLVLTYAVVTATDAGTGGTDAAVVQPISIIPVTIGVRFPRFNIQAGTFQSGYQLAWWVNGTTNQNVTWVHTSGPGTVTAGGLYKPPATSATIQEDILTATAAADNSSTLALRVVVFPQGGNPTNSIRLDSSSPTSQYDSSGNLWLADELIVKNGNYHSLYGGGYSDISWGNTVPDSFIWQTQLSSGDDFVWGPYIVPNGNYKITYYQGFANCTGNPGGLTQYWNNHQINLGPRIYEANGFIGARIDLGLVSHYQCRVPGQVSIPVTVTDNSLIFAEHMTGPEGSNEVASIINGVAIIPDTTAPYLAIDNQGTPNVSAGGTLQLYAVPWYFTDTGATWQIISGPGTIDSAGLYTAPSLPTPSMPVRIRCIDNGKVAETMLWVVGSTYPAFLMTPFTWDQISGTWDAVPGIWDLLGIKY